MSRKQVVVYAPEATLATPDTLPSMFSGRQMNNVDLINPRIASQRLTGTDFYYFTR